MMSIASLPRPLRLGVFSLALAVLLYLTLTPSDGLPSVTLWDKLEHGCAWAVLTGLGLGLALWRPGFLIGFTILLGAAVEVAQGAMGWGRSADPLDWLADIIGVAAAVLVWRLARLLSSARASSRDS